MSTTTDNTTDNEMPALEAFTVPNDKVDLTRIEALAGYHPMLTEILDTIASAKAILEIDPKSITNPIDVSLRGWARSVRKQGKRVFIEFDDGSTAVKLQLMGMKQMFDPLPTTGCGIFVNGKLVKSPTKGQSVEILIETCRVFAHDTSTPMAKAALTMDFLRTLPHLRLKNRSMAAIMRIRHQLTIATHMFFDQQDFFLMRTPIISTGDCEGAGEAFSVTASSDTADKKFFGQDVGLVVSGQLHGESGAQALKKIYTFGPTFRAENSHTGRHLAEFDMIEPEAVMDSLQENVQLANQYFTFCVKAMLMGCTDDLKFLDSTISPGLIEKLIRCSSSGTIVTYTEAIDIINSAPLADLAENEITWGDDLNSLQEKYIVKSKGDIPVFVIQYPKAIKSFYMLETPNCEPDRQTVECMDFLVPGVGELIGGSMRTSDYDTIVKAMTDKGMSIDMYQWYADLRRFGGLPTGGFGLGFERLVMFITGAHIRDCVPFPRYPGNITA